MRVLDMLSIFVFDSLRAASMKKRLRDWSGFPPELLEIIASKLKSCIDYVQFRAVCVKWRSSISSTTHHLPTQPPWLVFPYSSNIQTTDGSFLDISTNKFHRLNLMDSRDYRCCGSSQGWLVFIEQYTPSAMFLINPLTGNAIDLPPPVTSFKKVVLSSSPCNSDCIALAIVNETRELAFCKKGFEEWSFIEKAWSGNEDVIYYNGFFYAINNAGLVSICDLSGASPIVTLITVRAPRVSRHGVYYLVDSFGELMLVIRSMQLNIKQYDSYWSNDDSNAFYETYGFSVYKFVSSKREWVQMKTLGDHMLFLGGNSSVCLSSSSDFSGWKKNCIYFASEDKNMVDGNHDFGVYSLNGGSILPLPYGRSSSRHMLPPPIWVTPNPC